MMVNRDLTPRMIWRCSLRSSLSESTSVGMAAVDSGSLTSSLIRDTRWSLNEETRTWSQA